MLCDVGYVIQGHIPALMQIMTDHIQDYNMNLLTTKCLNTAVTIWYLFLGQDDTALKAVQYCDSRAVNERGISKKKKSRSGSWATDVLNPVVASERLGEELLSAVYATEGSCVTRRIFYVMMTDATLKLGRSDAEKQKQKQKQQRISFPGHVFVIEKVGRGGSDVAAGSNRYNLFQSYISKYTLEGHAVFNKSFAMSQETVDDVVRNIRRMYAEPVWSKETTRFWKGFTHVDASEFEGYAFAGSSHLCYQSVNTTNCVSHLGSFLRAKKKVVLDGMERGVLSGSDVYGDKSKFPNKGERDFEPFTNDQILSEIDTILDKL